MRRLLAIAAIVVGVGLIVEPLALKLFPRAAAGHRVLDRFRPTMSRAGLSALQRNFATVGAFTDELISRGEPVLAGRLKLGATQFDAYVSSNFPAVSRGLREIPPAAAFV